MARKRLPIDDAELAADYAAGIPQGELAEIYGCGKSTVQRRIQAYLNGGPTGSNPKPKPPAPIEPEKVASIHADEDAPWQSRGRCNDFEPELWFVEMAVGEAKHICRSCIVRDLCRDDALDRRDNHGVLGGLSAIERRRILAKRDRKRAA
jgi:WhiB family redox-sensing transcriptional regulator